MKEIFLMADDSHSVVSRTAQLLLIEDNPGDIVLVREAFKAAKIANTLHIARDGEEALKMLFQQEPYQTFPIPDLIFLDLNLPRKDGHQVLQELRSHKATQHIPVVVLTGSTAEIDILKNHQLKADCFVVKPLNFDQLKEIIAAIGQLCFAIVVRPTYGNGGSEE